jgi:GTP-binding protein YchF
MSLAIGIIGLPKSGCTSLFEALTHGHSTKFKRETAHVGMAFVPDKRLDVLQDLFQAKKVVPAEIKYIDLGATTKTPQEQRGIQGELLSILQSVDVIVIVVRAFSNASVPHIDGSIDVERDISAMNMELVFSDLAIIERRFDRIGSVLKSSRSDERQQALQERDLLHLVKDKLENDIPLRQQDLSEDNKHALSKFEFLTLKPLLLIVNVDEDQITSAPKIEQELFKKHGEANCRLLVVPVELDMEMSQLDEESAAEFRREFGIQQSGLERLIRSSFELLGLITFFSATPKEVRAWSVHRGISALEAAGKIHSDIERGFIKAEVITFDELVRMRGFGEAKKSGVLRHEGKKYIVNDGDFIHFLFNI